MVLRPSMILLALSSYSDAASDYDCAGGYTNWRNGWSDLKKSWCCQNRGLGCPDVSYPRTYPGSFPQAYRDVHSDYARVQHNDHYDCTAGYARWKAGWSPNKKDYCCLHQGLACPRVNYPDTYPGQFPPAYQEVYPDEYQSHVHYGGFGDDSHLRYDDRQRRDSYGSSVHLPYDCAAGYSKWRLGWSANKKDYCCQQRGLGCPGVNYPNSYPGNFPEGYQNAYPDEYHQHVHRAQRYSDYDCAVGYSNWQHGWSVEKKDHCCREQGLGCSGVDYPNTYPGRFPRVYQNAYPDEYQRHVHVHIHHHIHYTHSTPDYRDPTRSTYYDCDDGYANWRTGWSEDKKTWCCAHDQKGCLGDDRRYYNTPSTQVNHVTHVTHVHVYHDHDDPYDCSDLANWRENWPMAKKAWCCERHHRGCKPRYTTSDHRYYNQAEEIPSAGVITSAHASDGWRRAIFIGAGFASMALAAFAAMRARYSRLPMRNGEDLLAVE